MAWTPSFEAAYEHPNPFMDAIQDVFDQAFDTEPLTRYDPEILTKYVRRRRYDDRRSLEALLDSLPEDFRKFEMGPIDAEVIDTILQLPGCNLVLCGRRGAGKTSLLHFIEYIFSQCAPDYHFIIVSGRDQGETSFNPFVRSFKEQLDDASKRAQGSLAQHLKVASDIIAEDYAIEHIHRAILHLTTELPETLHHKLIFVFDNLDQLNKPLVDMALDVARVINVVKQLTTIVTARPGTFMGVSLRGSACAFFSYRIDVFPPDASSWLKAMKEQITKQSILKNFSNTVDGIRLNSNTLGQALERFASLLTQSSVLTRDSAQQRQDDVLHILQRVSSNDQRHLVQLVRRILSHRSLPYHSLLTDGSSLTFHPLIAMVEGERDLYKHDPRNPIVPNLLTMRCDNGTIEILLCHRILRLLHVEFSTNLDQLINWLSVCGYDKDCGLQCLNVLHQSGLVEYSDAEFFDEGKALPKACLLTESGLYYLETMFETVDYLTTVVVDVSLEHKYFKENGDSFVTRVESLLEYIEEVRQCEQRQIYQTLSKQKPATVALLRVSEALSNGGTLLASLTRGLEHIAARGRNSTSAPLRKMISERIESTIAQHKKTVNEFEDRLRQVANRGRQAHWSPGRWEKHLNSPSGAQITVSGLPRGDEILVSAKIKMNESCHSGLLNLEGQAGKQQIVSTAFATTSAEDPMTLTAHMGSFSRDLSYDTLGGVFVPFEPPEPATTRMRDRRALLAVNENYQGGLDVKLYFEHQNCDACPHQIGSISSADTLELESWCEEQLAEVGTIVGRGDNFNARLRSIGVGLERRVLTGEGRNTLETCLSNIDTLVIASRSHNIPWEWLTLPQRSPGAPPPSSLGDALRTIRFPNDPTLASMHLRFLDYSRPSTPLLTVGINTGAGWHYEGDIGSAEDLQRICQQKRTVHLVGHAQRDWMEFSTKPNGSPRTRVDVNDFGAFQLWDTNNVVISACQIASAKQSHNLAVAVSTKCRCIVWAPLVKIDIKHAQAIDEMLGEYLGSGSIEEFMKDKRGACPLLRLYVRYGLGTAPS